MTRFPDAAQLAARAHDVVLGAKAAALSLATAESLTAGMIAATIAEVPGASAVLTGGIISYSNAVKVSLLGVEEALLGERGSVDGEVARQMAQGARTACGADLAVSATGVAGPDTHDGQPVGTVFLGWADGSGSGFIEHHFSGDRGQVRARSTLASLDLLFSHLVPSRHTA